MSEDITLTAENELAILNLGRSYCLDIAGKLSLTRLLTQLRTSPGPARSVLLCATDPAAWLVDVRELVDMSRTDAQEFSHRGHQLAAAIAELPLPVIAAVDAPALGGGCELVLGCDIAFAGERASFGQIEAKGGVIPAFGGSWRLEERVGYQRALAMMFTGEIIDAQMARQYGIVLEVHASAELSNAAKAFASRVASCSSKSVAAIKRLTRAGRGVPATARDRFEEETFPAMFDAEQQARMRAFLQNQEQKRGRGDGRN